LSDTWADLQVPYPGDDTSAIGTNVYGNIKQLFLLKKKHRNFKTLLSIGGSSYSTNFPPVLSDTRKRQRFARSAVHLLSNLGFDGIDVDYESVTGADQAAQFVDLLRRIRSGLDRFAANISASPFTLSIASPAGPENYMQLDFAGMNQHVDFYNFMGFDYTGNWSKFSGHMSNLRGDTLNPQSTPFNTSSGIDYYVGQGEVLPSKINLGSPLYGRSFNNTAGPGTPFHGVGRLGNFGTAGVWDYKALPIAGSNCTAVNMPSIGASYSYDQSQRYMISYDTPEISAVKAKYIISNGLGGMMWWEVSMDRTSNGSLITAAVNTLGGVDALDKSLNHLIYPTSMYENLRAGFPAH
jgi:chitinase